MYRKSPRDIEFAVRMAINALRREIELNSHPTQLTLDDTVLRSDFSQPCILRPRDKHRRDLERAIVVLKAISAGVYDGKR